MKHYLRAFAAAAALGPALLASPGFAQTSEIALSRAVIQTERQAIITRGMRLTEEEAKEFWPLYREYRVDMDKVADRRVQLILDYAEAYNNDSLTDEQASGMIDDSLKIREDGIRVKKRYVRRFKKILPGKQVARFYHLEAKLDAIIDVDVAAQVPLVPF